MTTLTSGVTPLVSKPARRRKRAPMGGHRRSLVPAAWRAGQMYVLWVHDAVTRIAWATSPAATSPSPSTPAMIGNPPASALVQPAGRRRSDVRSNTAPDPAVGLPPFQCAA